MIENLQSNTKTPTAIAFKGEDRHYGSDATNKLSKNPENVFIKLNKFLAFDNIKNIENYFKSHNISIDEERSTLNFKIDLNEETSIFSIEEIYAMIFRYIQNFSNKFLSREIPEFILAIPSFFGYKQRLCLIQALQISGIKINYFISSNIAAGIFYALEKNFVKKEKNHISYSIIYDMGASYTQVALFSYNSHYKLEKKQKIEITNFRKLYETWDNSLGGNYFDLKIAEILANKFKQNFPNNINSQENKNNRFITKLLLSANKIKEILSANKEHKFNIIIDNENFTGNITRKEFEDYSEDLFDRVSKPLERLLETTNMEINNIESIQLIGGGIRIPKIRQILMDKFSSKKISNNLNGDDSISFGASYFYANKTINNFVYKNKKLFSLIKYPFNADFKIKLKNLVENEDKSEHLCIKKSKEENLSENSENENLINLGSEKTKNNDNNCFIEVEEERTLFAKDLNRENFKILNFKNKFNSDLILEVYENFKENKFQNNKENKNDLIVFYKLKDIANHLNIIRKEINESTKDFVDNELYHPTLNVIISFDDLGLINVKAEFKYEIPYYLTYEKTNRGDFKFFYTSKFTEQLDGKVLIDEYHHINTNENLKSLSKDEAVKLKKKLKSEIGNVKKETKKKEIFLEFFYSSPLPLTKKQIIKSKVKLNSLDSKDLQKQKFGEKLNNLENIIYSKLDWFKNSESKKFCSEDEEKKIISIILQLKEEIFDNTNVNPLYNLMHTKNLKNKNLNFLSINLKDKKENSNIDIIQEKILFITNLFMDIDKRVNNYKERNIALEDFENLSNLILRENKIFNSNGSLSISEDYDKLKNYFQNDVFKKYTEFENSLSIKLDEQSRLNLKDVKY